MRIAIASGKGGTGKTLVAVNLAAIAGRSVTLVDCDVEEPNDHIFLKGDIAASETVPMKVPAIDESRCTGCRARVEVCGYNALISFGGTPLAFPPTFATTAAATVWFATPGRSARRPARSARSGGSMPPNAPCWRDG